jgi:hypothetical protein
MRIQPVPAQLPRDEVLVDMKMEDLQVGGVKVKPLTMQKVRQKEMAITKQIQKPALEVRAKQAQKQKVQQTVAMKMAQKLEQQEKQIQKLVSARTARQGARPLKPPVVVPKVSLGQPSKEKKLLDIAGGIKAFEVQVRRFGKFTPITEEPLPKGKALKLGAEAVKKSLARTFKLVPKGVTKEPDITFGVSPKLFRRPKKGDKLTFIQKKELAFGTKLETAEAQKARKMKLLGKVRL